jgi:hypothetical protein
MFVYVVEFLQYVAIIFWNIINSLVSSGNFSMSRYAVDRL